RPLRTFLLTALHNFLVNEWHKARAQKRGGGSVLSLDWALGESRLLHEPADDWTPERLFERHWALALLDVVLSRLRQEYQDAGKEREFELLKGCLTGDPVLPYGEIATTLGGSENAVKVAAHRLRKRYRELLREEIGHTVAQPEEIDDEIQRLFVALGEP